MRRVIWLTGVLPFMSAFLGVLLAIMVAIPSIGEAQQARIRVDDFAIVGENGADRIRLQTGPSNAASLGMLNSDGQMRAMLATGGPGGGGTGQGAGLNLLAEDGTPVVRLGAVPMGAEIILRDAQGRPRIRQSVTPEGTASIVFLDADGNVSWSAP